MSRVGASISNVLYEPFGPVRQISYGDGYAQTRSFDQNYWVQSITSTRPVGLQAYFDQDAVGNITALSGSPIGSGGGSGTDRSIAYDNLYRITEVRDRNAALIESFSYDGTGNRLSKTASNGVATGSYGYPGTSHRLTSVDGVTRDYDAAGNLIEIQGSTSQPGFDFDARNRLVASTLTSGSTSTLASYDYNARGERVLHSGVDPLLTGDDRLYAYDESGRLLREYAIDGTPIQETLWLDDLPIATLRGSTAYPIEPDHLGSPRVVADDDDLLWQWDLLGPVFGEQAPNDTASGSLFRFDLRFPGQQYDAASGLNYNYFRDYEAGVGRYVESDPIGLGGGVGTYGYVSGNPVTLLDPFGLFETTATAWCRQHPKACAEMGGASSGTGTGVGAGKAAAGGATTAAAIVLPGDSSSTGERSRAIPWPATPKRGCTATCRADCNDLKPGNCPEDPNLRFQFATATAGFCADAVLEASRAANKALGCQAKHTQCKCTDRSGLQYNCKTG